MEQYEILKRSWESGCLTCQEFVAQAVHLGHELGEQATKLVSAYSSWLNDATNDALGG